MVRVLNLQISSGIEKVRQVMVTHSDALLDKICLVAAELTLQPVLSCLCSGVH